VAGHPLRLLGHERGCCRNRGCLVERFFVGVASRAVVEGSHISSIGLPVAAGFLAALVFALSRRPSVAANLGAVAGGWLSVIALVALAVAAPSLPLICQALPTTGNGGLLLLYPPASPLFDATERTDVEHCFAKQML
jgi:hypothetical protein